ncbi:serine protease [Teredinibacter turnerae]|uniref:serine protease n=1 Tax=Teredinibacter turnerae TaxID=2426 RepID=UPI00041F89FB|nr:serine protease [Teredinibacter turnerae]
MKNITGIAFSFLMLIGIGIPSHSNTLVDESIAFDELERHKDEMNSMLYRVKKHELQVAMRAIGELAESESEIRSAVRDLITPKIVGGGIAGDWENPFQVSLVVASIANNKNAHFCGGAFLSSTQIVTAAHCVRGVSPSQIQVVANTRRLDGTGSRVGVSQISIHPKFNYRTLDYDIAVVRLSSTVFNFPVDLAIEEPVAGSWLLVTGWGSLSEGGSSPTDLYALDIPVVSTASCNDANSYSGDITSRMFCAGYESGGKDSCQGDSGGPITGGNSNSLLTGVVSWGFGCARPHYPGVYTKIAHPEIRSFISSLAPAPVYPYNYTSYPYTVTGYGTQTNVYVRNAQGYTERLWGTRTYADLQATANAYCRGLGYNRANYWRSEGCGEDEDSFIRFDPAINNWHSRNSGSANNRGGYCRYRLMSEVSCAY